MIRRDPTGDWEVGDNRIGYFPKPIAPVSAISGSALMVEMNAFRGEVWTVPEQRKLDISFSAHGVLIRVCQGKLYLGRFSASVQWKLAAPRSTPVNQRKGDDGSQELNGVHGSEGSSGNLRVMGGRRRQAGPMVAIHLQLVLA